MKVLITGAKGFLGKNFIKKLKEKGQLYSIYEYDVDNTLEDLDYYCQNADAIFHFAAVQRPKTGESYRNNISLTERILSILDQHNNKCPIIFSSSIQAELDNEYGVSKKSEEQLLLSYGKKTGAHIFVFRFPNMFGTMSKPNYTSVVSTFCYNISHNLPVTINNPTSVIKLAYVNDVIDYVLSRFENDNGFGGIEYYPFYVSINLAELLYCITSLKINEKCEIAKLENEFVKKIESVYNWLSEIE